MSVSAHLFFISLILLALLKHTKKNQSVGVGVAVGVGLVIHSVVVAELEVSLLWFELKI